MLDLYYSDDLSVTMSQINGNLTVCSTAHAIKQGHIRAQNYWSFIRSPLAKSGFSHKSLVMRKVMMLTVEEIYECRCISWRNCKYIDTTCANYTNPGYGLSLVDTLWNAGSYRQPLEQEGNPMT